MTRDQAQEIFDECGIDEDVEGMQLYTSSRMEKRCEITSDRVCYDVNVDTLSDIRRLQGTEDIKRYILECQI